MTTTTHVRPVLGARILRTEDGDIAPMVGVYATSNRFGVGRRAVRRIDLNIALGPWELSAGLTNLHARAFGVPSWAEVSILDEFDRERTTPGAELYRWPVAGHPDQGRAIGFTWRTKRLSGRVLWHRPKPVRRSERGAA